MHSTLHGLSKKNRTLYSYIALYLSTSLSGLLYFDRTLEGDKDVYWCRDLVPCIEGEAFCSDTVYMSLNTEYILLIVVREDTSNLRRFFIVCRKFHIFLESSRWYSELSLDKVPARAPLS